MPSLHLGRGLVGGSIEVSRFLALVIFIVLIFLNSCFGILHPLFIIRRYQIHEIIWCRSKRRPRLHRSICHVATHYLLILAEVFLNLGQDPLPKLLDLLLVDAGNGRHVVQGHGPAGGHGTKLLGGEDWLAEGVGVLEPFHDGACISLECQDNILMYLVQGRHLDILGYRRAKRALLRLRLRLRFRSLHHLEVIVEGVIVVWGHEVIPGIAIVKPLENLVIAAIVVRGDSLALALTFSCRGRGNIGRRGQPRGVYLGLFCGPACLGVGLGNTLLTVATLNLDCQHEIPPAAEIGVGFMVQLSEASQHT